MAVGTSSRTPFKHWLLNMMLGRMVGAASTGRAISSQFVNVFDLCAGDGMDYGDDGGSSPAIIRRHMTSPFSHGRFAVRTATLYERESLTFQRLQERFGDEPSMKLICGDSRGITLADHEIPNSAAVLVYADPNSISTLPVTRELVRSFTDTTMFIMTLGCNVGGAKRMSRDEREKWFDAVHYAVETLRPWHDAHLITLNRDCAQWAYLMALPRKWSADILSATLKAGQKIWPAGVTGTSLRTHGKQEWDSRLTDLFLTEKEKSETVQQQQYIQTTLL